MGKNSLINVLCFDEEIGRVGFDEDSQKSFFQYNEAFIKSGKFQNLFPKTGIIKRVSQTQVFNQFNQATFRGLPPQIADSLPDMFGNIIFKTWLEANHKSLKQISIIEQLAYVANRGMGALEYYPSKDIPQNSTIDLHEIIEILQKVLSNKKEVNAPQLNSQALLNIFKIGTSAGGARPKILISEHKETGQIIPGDLEISNKYDHYLVKLCIDKELGYNPELIEYSYYLTATRLGINMMESKLIDDQHFATKRFDRQNGQKQHVLTATGITGWDFKLPENSSYENLFQLALFLKIPRVQIDELFKRMVFNVIFCNIDDHLKNHSFIYDSKKDNWNLSPAYDLTFALNPLINFKRTSRALSINGKRIDLKLNDLLKIADSFTIKNAQSIIEQVQNSISLWQKNARVLAIEERVISKMMQQFNLFV